MSVFITKYFKSSSAAEKFADSHGLSVKQEDYRGGKTRRWYVSYRKGAKKNPSTSSLPRNKWVNAKVRVTSSGKIQAKIPSSSLRKKSSTAKKRKR